MRTGCQMTWKSSLGAGRGLRKRTGGPRRPQGASRRNRTNPSLCHRTATIALADPSPAGADGAGVPRVAGGADQVTGDLFARGAWEPEGDLPLGRLGTVR